MPTIYEINTPIFLGDLSAKLGRQVDFSSVPAEVWDDLAAKPIDMIWFMGVWKRSEKSAELSRGQDWLKEALPDATDEDVLGSAYAIADYTVDERWGGDKALAVARKELKKRGISLMLDFVPNHVAIDHPWATDYPKYLLTGDDHELQHHPDSFVQTPGGIFANGRDPNFPAWTDVLQVNAFSAELRRAVAQTIMKIAGQCDGVRCDMAMLMINDIFHHTWGERAGDVPEEEYWPEVVGAAKAKNPDFIFLAEVYWDKQRELLDQGFDYCYDKDVLRTTMRIGRRSYRLISIKPPR